MEVLKAHVETDPDWTLAQHALALKASTDVKLEKSSIGNYFKRMRITIKKMFYPQERDEQTRKKWLGDVAKLTTEKRVFLDETSSFVNVSHAYAWASSYEPVFDSFPKGKKQRVSLIVAIGLRTTLSEHALLHPGSVDQNAFKAYLENVLLPRLESDITIVVHKGDDINAC